MALESFDCEIDVIMTDMVKEAADLTTLFDPAVNVAVAAEGELKFKPGTPLFKKESATPGM